MVEFYEWTDPVYRIQDDDLIPYRRYPKPRYRFDAPGGEYAVLYANDTQVATFNESYAEKRRCIPAADAKKYLVRITPKRPLPLVDFRDDRTLSALDLDARISVGDDYEAWRHWVLVFHEEWLEVGVRDRLRCSLGRRPHLRTSHCFSSAAAKTSYWTPSDVSGIRPLRIWCSRPWTGTS